MQPTSVVALAATYLSLLAFPAAGLAQTVLRNPIGALGEQHFGSAPTAMQDLNGDGVDDYLIGSPAYLGQPWIGAYSGATGSLLYTAYMPAGPNTPGTLGRNILALNDLNGDGIQDFVAISFEYDECPCEPGIQAYSGVDGTALYELLPRYGNAYDDYQADLFPAGDLDLDGKQDYAVYVFGRLNNNRELRAISGALGTQLWARSLYPNLPATAIVAMTPGVDQTGDGIPDIWAAAVTAAPGGSIGQLVLVSGANGNFAQGVVAPPGWDVRSVASFGSDLDLDGITDIVVCGFTLTGENKVAILSGSGSGTILREGTIGSGLGYQLRIFDSGRDVSGDGVPDLLVGTEPRLLSGHDLTLLEDFALLQAGDSTKMSSAVFIGDVSADGGADILGANTAYSGTLGQHQGSAVIVPGHEAIGSVYCTNAVANSTGLPAELSAYGSQLVQKNWLTLRVEQLPPSNFGMFLAAPATAFVANPGGSQGNLCLGGALGRFNQTEQIRFWGPEGFTSLAIDLSSVPTPTLPEAIQAGQTRNFQLWYRDQGGTSNFSTASAVTWQ